MCTACLYDWSQASTCQRLLEHFFHIAQRWERSKGRTLRSNGTPGLPLHQLTSAPLTRTLRCPQASWGMPHLPQAPEPHSALRQPSGWTSKGEAGDWQWTSVQVRIPLADVEIIRETSRVPLRSSGKQGKAELLRERRLPERPFQSTPRNGFPHKSVDQTAFDSH